MDIHEEVPIKSFSIAAYVCRIERGKAQFLIIKRQTAYLSNSWQMVSGKIEKGERAWEAALREIKEETGLVPDRFYSANEVELFYEVNQNCINLIPVFIAFIDSKQSVELSSEHSEYKWVSAEESAAFISFEHQTQTMHTLETKFVNREPLEFLRIKKE
ncbi:NUDIX domain-containing protein [Desulfobulbus rhabdoformis]|uniref:NUDIX hydrolase n=1 Tax=Desulfobulbus rhabdoformis TaxID=34032 RepID=UPI0019668A49|nr:NUDIX domain-containing protein [Desulfobulbus rhabdoformis]MBM9617002.1 NUDIX domain-containing protein [Desulfobulbus rhabdoformis]